jgi:hypothetical protein
MHLWWNGRHSGLRSQCLRAWEFKSLWMHQIEIFNNINRGNVKKCIKCKLNKTLDNFHKNKIRSDGLQTFCKTCSSSYSRGRDQLKKRETGKILVKRNKQFILDYLATHPCIDCGESDPVVLEFDHISTKNRCVTTLVQNGLSLANIQKEIDLCVIRCANCHRRKTAKQLGYYRFKV